MTNFKLNFIHLCDEVSFSQEGKLSIIGIFDVINLTNIPGSLERAYLVCNFTVLEKKLSQAKVNIIISNKINQEEVVKIPDLSVSIPKNDKTNPGKPRVVGISLKLVNVLFKEAGEYNISVLANDKKVGDYTFYVNLLKNERMVN